MISWLKKHFIPHQGNNHRPHALRTKNVISVVILLLLLEVFAFLIPALTYVKRAGTGNIAAVLPAVLSLLTNEQREAQKLSMLNTSPLLTKAAELKVADMVTKNYFAHTSPEGKTPWYWLEMVGYNYQYAGENLAVNFMDSKDVADAWMNSPTHRANIVKGNYTEIGTGIATGSYKGKDAVFVAQLYANPSKALSILAKKTTANVPVNTKVSNITKASTEARVLGVETTTIQTPNILQKATASPRYTTDIILLVVFCVMTFALLLYILIRFKNHHMDLITNGLIVLIVVLAIFIFNFYFSKSNMETQSIDYSALR